MSKYSVNKRKEYKNKETKEYRYNYINPIQPSMRHASPMPFGRHGTGLPLSRSPGTFIYDGPGKISWQSHGILGIEDDVLVWRMLEACDLERKTT